MVKPPGAVEMRRIREERQEVWRKKKATREHNKKERERKKKERNDNLIRKGEERRMKQPRLRRWARGEGGLEKDVLKKKELGGQETSDTEQSCQEGHRLTGRRGSNPLGAHMADLEIPLSCMRRPRSLEQEMCLITWTHSSY